MHSWSVLEIASKAMSCPAIDRKIYGLPAAGTYISVYPKVVERPAAYGVVEEQPEASRHLSISRNRKVIVTVRHVAIPGCILGPNEESLQELGPAPFQVAVPLCQLRTDVRRGPQDASGGNVSVNPSRFAEVNFVASFLDDAQVDNDSDSESTPADEEETFPGPTTSSRDLVLAPVIADNQEARAHVLKDVFHLMDSLKYSQRHGLAKEFSRRLRDAIFVVDPQDRDRIEAFLRTKNTTWERKLSEDARWILRRVKRTVPPPQELLSTVKDLFSSYGDVLCVKSGNPLFDREGWRKARLFLSAVKDGEVSDPPGVSFYHQIGVDKDSLPLYRCTRGTNSIEGGVHQNVIRKFASYSTSPRLADYRLRHNLDVSLRKFHLGKVS